MLLPYFMLNDRWYLYDEEKDSYSLTPTAPFLAVQSFNEYEKSRGDNRMNIPSFDNDGYTFSSSNEWASHTWTTAFKLKPLKKGDLFFARFHGFVFVLQINRFRSYENIFDFSVYTPQMFIDHYKKENPGLAGLDGSKTWTELCAENALNKKALEEEPYTEKDIADIQTELEQYLQNRFLFTVSSQGGYSRLDASGYNSIYTSLSWGIITGSGHGEKLLTETGKNETKETSSFDKGLALFDPYFNVPAYGISHLCHLLMGDRLNAKPDPENPLILTFRKIEDPVHFLSQALEINDTVIHDLKEVVSFYTLPYSMIKIPEEEYVNDKGNRFDYRLLLQFLLDEMSVMKNTVLRNIADAFGSYFQNPSDCILHYGFSNSEVEKLAHRYLIFDPRAGEYSCWDTEIEDEEYFFLIDKEYFSLIYNWALKCGKTAPQSCEEVTPVPGRSYKAIRAQKKLAEFYLPDNVFQHICSLAKEADSFEGFFQAASGFLKKLTIFEETNQDASQTEVDAFIADLNYRKIISALNEETKELINSLQAIPFPAGEDSIKELVALKRRFQHYNNFSAIEKALDGIVIGHCLSATEKAAVYGLWEADKWAELIAAGKQAQEEKRYYASYFLDLQFTDKYFPDFTRKILTVKDYAKGPMEQFHSDLLIFLNDFCQCCMSIGDTMMAYALSTFCFHGRNGETDWEYLEQKFKILEMSGASAGLLSATRGLMDKAKTARQIDLSYKYITMAYLQLGEYCARYTGKAEALNNFVMAQHNLNTCRNRAKNSGSSSYEPGELDDLGERLSMNIKTLSDPEGITQEAKGAGPDGKAIHQAIKDVVSQIKNLWFCDYSYQPRHTREKYLTDYKYLVHSAIGTQVGWLLAKDFARFQKGMNQLCFNAPILSILNLPHFTKNPLDHILRLAEVLENDKQKESMLLKIAEVMYMMINETDSDQYLNELASFQNYLQPLRVYPRIRIFSNVEEINDFYQVEGPHGPSRAQCSVIALKLRIYNIGERVLEL